MKTSLIVGMIIGIGISIIASGFLYQETYNQNCIEGDGKVTGFLKCTRVFVFPEDPNELECPEHFIIFENNCVPVNSENRFTFDASIYFKSVDGKITELCERDFEEVPEVETCQDTKFYTIENNEIKFYIPSNYSQPYDGREPVENEN